VICAVILVGERAECCRPGCRGWTTGHEDGPTRAPERDLGVRSPRERPMPPTKARFLQPLNGKP